MNKPMRRVTTVQLVEERTSRGPNEQQLRAVLEALPVALYITDAEGRITWYNQAATELWGVAPEIGSARWCGSWRLYNTDGTPLPHDQCQMARALKENRAIRDEGAIAERPDGTRIPFVAYPTPLRDNSGALTGAVNMLIDVSDRQLATNLEHRLASIVESSDDAIVSKDLNGIIATWNKGAERLFGYAADEVIGKSITILIPLDRRNEETEIIGRVRRGDRIEHYETLRRRKDGSLVEISLTVSPIRDSTGMIVGASKIAHDITERRRAEMRQKTLLDELNHRVKNTLATVQSLAAHTLRGTSLPQDVRDTFEGRLFALGRAHDQLSQGSWEAADLQLLMRDVVAPFHVNERIQLEGGTAMLPPQTALMLTMVLHELATNAAKYGALSGTAGVLTVKWHVVDSAAAPRLEIDWQESGGPPVRPPTRRGFGSRLVERAVKQELNGEAKIDFAPAGLHCRIAIPLPKI